MVRYILAYLLVSSFIPFDIDDFTDQMDKAFENTSSLNDRKNIPEEQYRSGDKGSLTAQDSIYTYIYDSKIRFCMAEFSRVDSLNRILSDLTDGYTKHLIHPDGFYDTCSNPKCMCTTYPLDSDDVIPFYDKKKMRKHFKDIYILIADKDEGQFSSSDEKDIGVLEFSNDSYRIFDRKVQPFFDGKVGSQIRYQLMPPHKDDLYEMIDKGKKDREFELAKKSRYIQLFDMYNHKDKSYNEVDSVLAFVDPYEHKSCPDKCFAKKISYIPYDKKAAKKKQKNDTYYKFYAFSNDRGFSGVRTSFTSDQGRVCIGWKDNWTFHEWWDKETIVLHFPAKYLGALTDSVFFTFPVTGSPIEFSGDFALNENIAEYNKKNADKGFYLSLVNEKVENFNFIDRKKNELEDRFKRYEDLIEIQDGEDDTYTIQTLRLEVNTQKYNSYIDRASEFREDRLEEELGIGLQIKEKSDLRSKLVLGGAVIFSILMLIL